MELNKIEKQKNLLINAAYFVFIGGILFLIFKYFIPFLAPFLIGFSVAFILKPISRFLCRNLHFQNNFCGTLVVLLAYVIVILLVYFVGGRVIEVLKDFSVMSVKIYSEFISPLLNQINNFAVNLSADISSDLAIQTDQFLNVITSGIQNSISSISQSLVLDIAKFTMAIPNFIVGLIFAVMSSIFISSDYNNIASFLSRLLPKKFRPALFETKGYAVETVIKYIRAYFILMVLTFVEILIGLIIIGANNPVGCAAAIAFCDALPLLGTGIVLLPWCLLSFAMGNFSFAVGVLVIYLVVSVLRSYLEPKVLGKQLGLHPLATLLSVYAGLKIFGIAGMILFPIALQILVRLYRSGHFIKLKNV